MQSSKEVTHVCLGATLMRSMEMNPLVEYQQTILSATKAHAASMYVLQKRSDVREDSALDAVFFSDVVSLVFVDLRERILVAIPLLSR